jgi:mannose-6-phosphate isomerase-like protein (cupin superfamily)
VTNGIAPGQGISLSDGEGQSWWLLTDQHTFKATGSETGGAFALAHLQAGPDFGPPPHIHHRADEAFYILDGEFEFMYEGKTFVAGPGSFVYLKKGRVHMHKAHGGKPARAIVVQTPAGIEGFIAEAGKPGGPGTSPDIPSLPDLERIVGIAKKYDIEVPQA